MWQALLSTQEHETPRDRWLGYGAALIAVAAVSGAIGLVLAVADVANISLLYLVVILVISSRFGRGPAIVASFVAFFAFNWFFVAPIHTFTVARTEEVIALIVLLLTAVVTGQLAAVARTRNRELLHREREAQLLRAIVALLNDPHLSPEQARGAVEARLRTDLDLQSAQIDLASANAQHAALAGDPQHRRVLVLNTEDGVRLGRLLALRAPDATRFDARDDALLQAAAVQLGAVLERLRLRQEATEVETLRRTDELKTALLNAVSHDLRTPLASILAAAESLRQPDIRWSDEEREEFLAAIEQEAQRLNNIVGNLLDLSRIQGGSLHPERQWHDLAGLIADAVARLRARYPDHAFALDLPDDLPPLYLDPVQIDQVVVNLLDNAAKYSPPRTKIWLSVQRSAHEVRVQVADRGRGMPAETLRHLFTPFYRVLHRRAQPGPPGTGLGLAVARGLIAAHGGQIWAANRDDGGAIFTFTLPLLPPALGTDPELVLPGATVAVAPGPMVSEEQPI